jgi:hypothetical protein
MNLKKRKESYYTKAQQAELERGWRDRNVWLKSLCLPKETLEQYIDWVYGRGKKEKTKTAGWTKCSSSTTIRYPIRSKETSSTEKTKHSEVQDGSGKDTVQVSRPSNWITGPCTSKPSPTYTGTKMIGIGTMHKSNMVPIFSDEEAKDISKMRR